MNLKGVAVEKDKKANTININTEMNYWPAEVTNLGNTTEPLYSLIKDLSVTGAQTSKEMYGDFPMWQDKTAGDFLYCFICCF